MTAKGDTHLKKKHLRRIVTVICIIAVLISTAPGALAAGATLKVGSSGSEVTKLQNRLIALGYTDFSASTGYYGSATKTAVTRFQGQNGLTADGVAGSATQGKLYSSSAKSLTLKTGSSGEAVQALQLRLKALGHFSGTGTGYYGVVTKAAVTSFQKASGLTADGIAGAKTRTKAFSSNAVSAGSTASASTGSGSAAIADIALAQLGDPYVLGANGPDSFDCSGLAYYAMTNAGFPVSRLSAAAYSGQSTWAKITDTGSLKKGDLLFFYSESWSSINHMGVYTDSGQFVHASSGQGKVMTSDLSNTYWAGHFAFARRVS
jgi:peptidoglycan hydrolase-like protein with peptidoglycan-binding domain